MANTIRAAKNTFNNGLVMDLAPDTTPNEVLTSALNATLVTFNGNELQLQNDMGNGRVETARLPEGYIPVGTCEFGDIIYIVSYNPLTNRSQIGCFPSPERNISSEEIGSNGQTLSSSDFQEGSFDENEHFIPSGELKATSVKKIIYNNKMNPGDKYIIYDSNNQILNETHITDIGNTSHVYGAFPKLLRIHVVAIEDSGKINYLDSTVKWYNKKLNNEDADYFMMANKVESGSSTNAPDIDSYRDLLSSGYSVFQSKISGKLALLIELEKITGFSCTYNTYTSQKPISISETGVIDSSEAKPPITIDNIMNKKCRIYWNINWENDDNNINPKYIVLTKSEWGSKKPSENTERETKAGHYYLWRKDNQNVINDVKVDISSNIPKAYPYSNNGNVYWYAEISRLYDPLENISYSTFINARSYDKQLETALIPIKQDYNNQELYKLNLSRKDIKIGDYDYIGLPREDGNKSYYFINLISIERKESPQDPNAPTLYTGYISDFTKSEGRTAVNDYLLSDDIVNNYFHTSVSKFFYTFNIPVEQNIDGNIYTPDTSNLIYHYEITPAMDYGLLREYSVEGYIDFSKIGTGLIDLTHWKYFNAENISTLTLGLDAYVEENKGIAEIALEFYDNQGYAATYHIRDKESYSGVFTEVIPLNGVIQNANLDDIDAYGEKHTHLGPEATDFAENVGYVTKVNGQPIYNPLYYKQVNGEVVAYEDSSYQTPHTTKDDLVLNDAGVIYGNVIYLVKIVVKYCQKDVLGNLDPSLDSEFKTFYRWYWTNTAFNSSYTNTNDFNTLQPSLVVDADVRYEMDNSQYSQDQYPPLGQETDDRDLAKSAGVILQKMQNQQIKVYASPYLYNNYNTFKLLGNKNASDNADKGVYYGLNLKICSGKRYIEQYLLNGSKEPPIQIHTGEYSASSYAEWGGMEFVPGDSTSTSNMQAYDSNWRSTADGYKRLTDDFRITFREGQNVNHQSGDPEGYYINKNSEYISKSGYTEKYFGASNIDDGINVFTLNLQHYSKYYVISRYINKSATALVPIIQTVDDMDKYNIGVDKNQDPYIKTRLTIQVTGQGHDTDDVKFWNHGGSGEEWSFWVDSDVDYLVTIDVWRIDESGSKTFRGTYLDCWNNINTVQLSQFDYESNKPMYHRQNGGSYGEGGLTGYSCNGKVSNLTDGDGHLLSPGFFTYWFYQSKPTDGDNKAGVSLGNQKNNTEGQNDFNSDISPYGIGFVDQDHNLHLFNTKAGFSNVEKVFSELTQLYILNGADTLNVLSDIDTVYLQDNYTLYTQDVIYEYYSNGGLKDNQLITIYDFNYIKYIEAILEKVGVTNNVTNYKFTDDKGISMNNVNITLKYSSRNVPLEFKMDYKKPNTYSSVEADDTKILLKMLGGSQKLVSALDPINSTTLYQYVSTDNTVKEVDGSFKFNICYIGGIKSGNIVPSFGSLCSASRFCQVFKYSGDYLDFVTKEYSAANDYWSYGHQYKGYVGTLCDLLIKDVLIDGEQIVPLPQNYG